jgi:hypothetical protein
LDDAPFFELNPIRTMDDFIYSDIITAACTAEVLERSREIGGDMADSSCFRHKTNFGL